MSVKDLTMTSTGAISASTQVTTVSTQKAVCFGYAYSETGGSNGVGIELLDGGSSGTKKWATSVSASGSDVRFFPAPMAFNTDLYVKKTGSGTLNAYVLYR